jgi:hypothetical protein
VREYKVFSLVKELKLIAKMHDEHNHETPPIFYAKYLMRHSRNLILALQMDAAHWSIHSISFFLVNDPEAPMYCLIKTGRATLTLILDQWND